MKTEVACHRTWKMRLGWRVWRKTTAKPEMSLQNTSEFLMKQSVFSCTVEWRHTSWASVYSIHCWKQTSNTKWQPVSHCLILTSTYLHLKEYSPLTKSASRMTLPSVSVIGCHHTTRTHLHPLKIMLCNFWTSPQVLHSELHTITADL